MRYLNNLKKMYGIIVPKRVSCDTNLAASTRSHVVYILI